MKVERDVILTCTRCGVEGSHELLYLSGLIRASRCGNCAYRRVYSGSLYASYARDVVQRGARLPVALVGRAIHDPLELFSWPVKGVRKPIKLLGELNQVARFEPQFRCGFPLPRHSRPGV